MQISLPILLKPSQLTLAVIGVSQTDYSYSVLQTTDLSIVEIDLIYFVSLQGKNIQISYSQSRRLLEENRLLASLSFSSTINLDTYPPAYYYPDTTLSLFNSLQSYISALATALLVLTLILVPKRTHLHSLTLISLPAQLFLTYAILPSSYTDWIQYTLKNISSTALVGGFSFG